MGDRDDAKSEKSGKSGKGKELVQELIMLHASRVTDF